MSSRLETRQLQELIPQYAAKYTDEKWEYYYSENVDSVMGHIEQYSKQDVIGWDVTANGAEEELINLRKHCPASFLMIFASSRMNPMRYVKAGVNPDSLVLKPYEKEDLMEVLDESFSVLGERISKSKNDLLTVYTGNAQKYLQVDIIDYVEAREKKVFLKMKKEEYGMYDSLEDISKRLPHSFVRCHRSYIINMSHIDKMFLSENYIIMKNGDRIPVSRTYKKAVKEYGIKNI